MLKTEYEILHMLYELPEKFKVNYAAKRWAAAKNAYDAARTMSVYLQLDQKHRETLFGNRAYAAEYEEIKDGLFPEKMVSDVYLQCIKTNQTREYETCSRKIT